MADPPLYRRGKIWWTRVDGERVTTGLRDRQAALLRARDLERRAADPLYKAASETTVASAVRRYLAHAATRDIARGTLSMYEQKCGHVVRVFGADMPLIKLDAAAVDRYVLTRRTEVDDAGNPAHASDNTIGKELTALRQVLKLAHRDGLYPRHPSAVMPINWDTKYQPRRTSLTPEQLERLCAELPPGRAAYVLYVVATGARRSELFAARRVDVDWDKGLVRLRGTKTRAADDDVPILPLFQNYLARAVKDAPGQGLIALAFPPWGNDRRDLLAACERARVPAVTWNDLRRTAGQWLRRAGVAPHLIGRFLRHTTSRMAELVYATLDAPALGQLLAEQMAPKIPKKGGRRA